MAKALRAQAGSPITGTFRVAGDKSISHRSLMLGSQTVGKCKITGLLEGEDVLATMHALQTLGVTIEHDTDNNAWYVHGVGIGGLQPPQTPLDLGNAGTGVRLLMGLVSSYPFSCKFTGDKSLSSRPMNRVIVPLQAMGVQIEASEGGRLPLTLSGGDIIPISYRTPVPSAQVKSAVLLAGLNAPGMTEIIESEPTRDHTERMLRYLGAKLDIFVEDGERHIVLHGRPYMEAKPIDVPGDPSSAAFLAVAALLVPESDITIEHVCFSPERIGLYTTLQEMGADISYINQREVCGEDVADIRIRYSPLKGIHVPAERAPTMIDEYPVLAVAAALASGKTVMNGIAELKVKESNRLNAIADGLRQCNVEVKVENDRLTVHGNTQVTGNDTPIQTHMDHRIAMAFLILGLRATNGTIVDDGSMINTSFPGFVELVNQLGGTISHV